MKEKEPLYRKVNTKARGCSHLRGSDYSRTRNTKSGKENDPKMKHGVARGLDYTPLFRFLLSKVGKDWDSTLKEALSRLDKSEPIYWMVAENKESGFNSFRTENTFFSGLYVDENNILQIFNKEYTVNDIIPQCDCCTYSFNGKAVTNKCKRHSET